MQQQEAAAREVRRRGDADSKEREDGRDRRDERDRRDRRDRHDGRGRRDAGDEPARRPSSYAESPSHARGSAGGLGLPRGGLQRSPSSYGLSGMRYGASSRPSYVDAADDPESDLIPVPSTPPYRSRPASPPPLFRRSYMDAPADEDVSPRAPPPQRRTYEPEAYRSRTSSDDAATPPRRGLFLRGTLDANGPQYRANPYAPQPKASAVSHRQAGDRYCHDCGRVTPHHVTTSYNSTYMTCDYHF